MGSLIALLFIVAISLLIVRIGTNALVLTGMSAIAAQFQAASAFFGVGFTTSEAEMVMQHAARRRIILHLIIAGNIGLTSALAAIIGSLISLDGGATQTALKLLTTVVFIILIAIGMNLRVVKKHLDALMCKTLLRAGVGKALDYNLLLNVDKGYCVSETLIEEGHRFSEKPLCESRPADYGVVILGIEQSNGDFIGAPNKDSVLCSGDTALLYGHMDKIEEFTKGE